MVPPVLLVPGGIEVLLDPGQGGGVRGHEANLAALAVHAQMFDPTAVLQVPYPERAQLGPAQPVVEQHRQDRSIPLAFEGIRRGRVEQRPRLSIPDGRRLALVGVARRPLHSPQRIEGHGVPLTQMIEQARQRRQLPPDGGRRVATPLQLLAPGERVGAGHQPELPRPHDAHERHELADVALVRPPRPRIGNVGEPLGLGRHVAQALELGGGEQPTLTSPQNDHLTPSLARFLRFCAHFRHPTYLLMITLFINNK